MQWTSSGRESIAKVALILARRVSHHADTGQTCFSECNQILTFEQLPSDDDSYRVDIYELNLDRPGP